MGFEIRVVRNNPLTGETDLDNALREFLGQIGYLPKAFEDETGFHLVRDCFLSYPEKAWTIEELLTVLATNKATLYRYLNKLKGMDLLDEVQIGTDDGNHPQAKKIRKGYKFRFDSLSLAWSLVESHTNVAMSNYRKSVDHIDRLSRSIHEGNGPEKRKDPKLSVDAIVLKGGGAKKEVLLIKRKKEPFKGMWALPGGFVEYGETVEEAVIREAKEETGLSCTIDRLYSIASRPDRDPRGHTVSAVFLLYPEKGQVRAGDDAVEAGWFNIEKLPDLAFDHAELLKGIR